MWVCIQGSEQAGGRAAGWAARAGYHAGEQACMHPHPGRLAGHAASR